MIEFVGNWKLRHFLGKWQNIWIYYPTNQVFIRMPRGWLTTVASDQPPATFPSPRPPFHLAHTFTYYRFPAAPGGDGPAQMAAQHVTPTRPTRSQLGRYVPRTWTPYLFRLICWKRRRLWRVPMSLARACPKLPAMSVWRFHLSTIFHAHCALCIRMTPPTAARSLAHVFPYSRTPVSLSHPKTPLSFPFTTLPFINHPLGRSA